MDSLGHIIERDIEIELEGLVKRCSLEDGKRPNFSCFWPGELGGKSAVHHG